MYIKKSQEKMYIKKITKKNGEYEFYEWYLCDVNNQLTIHGNSNILKLLEGYELGTYDYLFNKEMLFQWKRRSTTIELSDRLSANPKAWIREIKIKNLLSDD